MSPYLAVFENRLAFFVQRLPKTGTLSHLSAGLASECASNT